MRGVDFRRVEGGVEPEDSDVKNPDPIEVDQKVSCRTFLVVRLKENAVPVNVTELHKTLRRGNVNETGLYSCINIKIFMEIQRSLHCPEERCGRYLRGTRTTD